MDRTSKRDQIYIYLALILISALGLRIWGIWFGLPFSYRADEYHEVFRALELGTGGFNFERTGKGGYFYLLFVEYGVLFVALTIAGIVDSAQDFARYFARDASYFYLISRATTAVIGTLNVYLVYRLGSRAYSVGAGVLAAIFLSVDFMNAEHSHFVTVDVPMTCLATAALLFAVRMAIDGSARDYKWAALFAALATTTKVPAILLLVPLLIAHYYFVKRQDGGVRELFLSRHLWWAVVIFAIVLLVTNPGYVVSPPSLGMFAETEGMDAQTLEDESTAMSASEPPNLFIYYFGVLMHSLGWPLFLIALAGVLYGLYKRTAADIMLLSFGAIFYVVFAISQSHWYYPRYMLPLIVVLTLLAGRLLCIAWPRAGGAKRTIAVVLVGLMVAVPAYRTAANDYLLSQPDTRSLAKQWFDEQVPPGSKVLIEGLKIEPTRLTVPLQDTPENMRDYMAYYKTREPGKSKYLNFKLQVLTGISYDLEFMRLINMRSLDFYKDAGIEYMVIRPEAMEQSRRAGPNVSHFLDALVSNPELTLLKSFRSNPVSRPGPDIDIYRIDPNVVASDDSPTPSRRRAENRR